MQDELAAGGLHLPTCDRSPCEWGRSAAAKQPHRRAPSPQDAAEGARRLHAWEPPAAAPEEAPCAHPNAAVRGSLAHTFRTAFEAVLKDFRRRYVTRCTMTCEARRRAAAVRQQTDEQHAAVPSPSAATQERGRLRGPPAEGAALRDMPFLQEARRSAGSTATFLL